MLARCAVLACLVGCYAPSIQTGTPCVTTAQCPRGLVCSPATQTCEYDAIDARPIDAGPDAFVAVVGAGTIASPFRVVAGTTPASCDAFLTAYPAQANRDGIYHIAGATQLDVYCDMAPEGGWTLVARVLGSSNNHTTTAALGVVTDPAQTTTAKLADAIINSISYKKVRFVIEGAGTFFASVSTLDLSDNDFTTPAAASSTLAGPYDHDFLTQTGCGSDCGVDVVRPDIGFGNNCGYRYYASGGNPRPGMGCQGNAGNAGTVWIK